MKERFWLLDLNYEVKEGEPEIWLWGVNEEGSRILVIDRGFQPYFYLLLQEGVDPKTVLEGVEALRSRLHPSTRMEVVERKLFGKPVKAIKIYCQDPDSIPQYANLLSKVEGVKCPLEDDIRYSMRYLIDNDVTPCMWHEVEVEPLRERLNVQADKVYLARSRPKKIGREEPPKLRVLAFSAIYYSPKGSPKPERSPVAIISTVTSTGEERQIIAENIDGDKVVIEDFIHQVKEFDPDIIVGYGTNRMDWEFLQKRARKMEVKFTVDRVGAEPHRSVYGHISITGRANIDLLDFADELPEVKVKTLENVADYLGVMKVKDRLLIEDVEIAEYWENPEKRPLLAQFSMENAKCVMGIYEALADFAVELSKLVGLPLDQIGRAAVGFRVEWFLIREAYRMRELIPRRVERRYRPYAGGMVLKPKPGIHEDVAVLDFKSMYPNIMIEYNISPDTYLDPSEPEPPQGVNVAPEVGHRFVKAPPGFYKRVLSGLISVRDEIRRRLRKVKPGSVEYRVLDARQKAVKVITNATYGYAGWVGARWYIKPIAEATTAWGRSIILNTIETARSMGLEVIYSDTDSIFIKYDPEKIKALSKRIEEKIGLEIKPDKIYKRIFFTEAKKRYCGLLPNGELDIVGLEVVRGDWAAIAKNVQEEVLRLILKEKSVEKAVRFVQKVISSLRERRIPYKDLVIWKTLTRPVEKYAVKAPHVEAAKILMKEGWELSPNDKVGYVIVEGPGRLYKKAKPHILASYEELDIEYYVSNQIVPAALRVLSMFGVTADDLNPPKTPKTLFDFLKKG
ncbi:MAG: DNA polymerase [Candidatus Bathyarchaeota archaeon B26-1]|nr:MAG: DNA polymerase [Candidatus Bathyarchaeota archaeon B26-1]